ncbi:AEC family transporter [Zoogloea sp.]|uniref:AEC family transporter n=1 Tax=Zoogloea sp. TaxID=49181 RepID=UPI00141571EA|nr:MAG: AEC family transporter [Zoogloea sp.]
MTEFLAVLEFSFSVTGPIFVILGLGVWLRRAGMLTDGFVNAGSELVFKIALPALLFLSVTKTHVGESANLALVGYGLAATAVVFAILEVLAHFWVQPPEDRGVVVQAAFRSNLGVIGLAYCVNAYGEAGLIGSSLYVGLLTILFNIFSVVTLSRSLHKRQGVSRVLRNIVTNPLIVAIALALCVSFSGLVLPRVLVQSGQYLADLTLPLALLCTGAALNFKTLRAELGNTAMASVVKLVLVPLAYTAGAIALGFRGMSLGIVMLMASAPSAAASYVMVRAMGGNGTLAANIVAITTLGSLVTTTSAITILRGMGLM